MNTEQERQAFEQWINKGPIKYNLDKFPDKSAHYVWTGRYCFFEIQLAWEAWLEAKKGREEK